MRYRVKPFKSILFRKPETYFKVQEREPEALKPIRIMHAVSSHKANEETSE